MGKAKRINDRHASETSGKVAVVEKKNKWLTPVIAGAIAFVVIACLVLAAVQSSGAILRSKKPFRTEHVTITGSMFQYQYMSYYQYYISQVDESMEQYLQYLQNYYLSSAMSAAESDCEVYAVYGEAAHQAGLKLDDSEKETVQTYMDNLEYTASYYGYSSLSAYLSAAYGEGVKAKDVKAMYELTLLCNKYETQMAADMEAAITDDDVVKYYEDNADDYITASYLGYSFKATLATVNSSDYSTTEEYNAALQAAQDKFALDKLEADAKAEALTHATSAAEFTAMLAEDSLTPTAGTDVVKANLSQDDVIAWIFTDKAAVNATKAFGAGSDSEYTAVAYIITKSAGRDETVTKNIQYIVNTADKLTQETADKFVAEFKASDLGMSKESMLALATTYELTDASQYAENVVPADFNLTAVSEWLASDAAVPGAVAAISGTLNETAYTLIVFVDSNGDPAWKVSAKTDCLSGKVENWLTEAKTTYNLKTDLTYWMSDDAE